MSKDIEAVVFDVDGTLLDTREFIFQAYEYSLASHGHAVPDRSLIAKQVGRSLQDCYKALAPEGDNDALSDIHHEFQEHKFDLISAYDGLEEMLSTLKEADIKIAAFSSRRGNLVPSIKNAGIYDYFETIINGLDVVNHKPHPEGLHLALGRMSVSANRAVMIGDADVDIQAGKLAGVKLTIGITHGFGTRDDILNQHPDFVVDHLSEVPAIVL